MLFFLNKCSSFCCMHLINFRVLKKKYFDSLCQYFIACIEEQTYRGPQFALLGGLYSVLNLKSSGG